MMRTRVGDRIPVRAVGLVCGRMYLFSFGFQTRQLSFASFRLKLLGLPVSGSGNESLHICCYLPLQRKYLALTDNESMPWPRTSRIK